jgi:tagatose-1,6-bisphosphate aldolase non-catalytic subunit AgaZ/GatZ
MAVRSGTLVNRPKDLIIHKVMEIVHFYSRACGLTESHSGKTSPDERSGEGR